MEQNILERYRQQIALSREQVNKYQKLSNTYSLLRLGVFALMVLAIYFTIKQDNFTIAAIAFIILIICFAWLVSRQAGFEQQKKYYQNLIKINENEVNSILNHTNLYDNGGQFISEKHFYTSDLDIYGPTSLFELINRAATTTGKNKLAAWLSAPAQKAEILLRQNAIKELSNKGDWKTDLQARLLFAADENTAQLQGLFTYLKIPLNLPGEKSLSTYIKIAPYLLLAAIIAGLFYPVFTVAAMVLALANLLIITSKGSYILKAGAVADKIGNILADYAVVFKKIEDSQWETVRCAELNEKLRNRETSEKITELSGLVNKLSYNLIMIVGFMLNIFFLWALKQIIAIENWKRSNHQNLEDAFEVIAEFEALISLASPAINYPQWVFPTIADSNGYTLTARDIIHPLVKGTGVANSYELKNAYHADIITGSNMAGKSTFLRTIGINTVLALSGAPVYAVAMEVSVMTMVTYMRIKDSLNESTSTFKAELDRLQMLLAAIEQENRVFFLIDEMLRGTNSIDKYLGSRAVIEQLISKKGVGMVATHDLQIAHLIDKYPAYVRNFYFDIQVIDGKMLFDYKIKHGECKTFNASLLLRQIGINVKEE